MSILSTSSKLIKVGQDYIAGSGISIDDHVISVTGEFGKTYSAGNNVDIYEQDEQLYISSKDWTNDIANASANAYNEAVAQIPDPFDPSYLSAQIDNKLNSSDFTTWQNGQYTTDLQTIEGQISNKLDTSSFRDVSGSFLTAHQSLDGYATEDWVTAQGYITGVDLSPYYTTAEANSLSSMLSGAIDYVSANADNVEVTNVVQTNSGVWNEVSNKLDATAFSNVSGSFYTNDNPSGFITGVDLSNYYTKDETSGKEELAQAFADIPVGDPEVNAYVTDNSATINGTTDLVQNSSGLWNDVAVYQSNSANYLTAHQDISYKLDESAFADVSGTFLTSINIPESASWEEATQAYEQNSGTYITAHQSLDGYATEDWVTGQGYITGVNITESATWNDVSTTVQTNSSNWDNVTNKLDTTAFSDVSGTFLTAHQDLSDYQTIEGMTAYQEAGDYASINDLENYQPVSSMTAYQPVGDYVQGNDLELNSYNKISAISGHEIAGGGGSVEFDYDSNGDISGINSSAISDSRAGTPLYVESPLFTGQSGNSAYIGWQGYNETKLWISDTTGGSNIQTFNLNEPYTNFERIKLYFRINDGDAGCAECLTSNSQMDAITMANYSPASTGTDIAKGLRYYLVNGNQISAAPTAMFKSMAATAVNHESYSVFYVQEIIGVNRKQV